MQIKVLSPFAYSDMKMATFTSFVVNDKVTSAMVECPHCHDEERLVVYPIKMWDKLTCKKCKKQFGHPNHTCHNKMIKFCTCTCPMKGDYLSQKTIHSRIHLSKKDVEDPHFKGFVYQFPCY